MSKAKNYGKNKKSREYKPLSKDFINSVVKPSKSVKVAKSTKSENVSKFPVYAEIFEIESNKNIKEFIENRNLVNLNKIDTLIYDSKINSPERLNSNDTKGVLFCIRNVDNKIIGFHIEYNGKRYILRADLDLYRIFIHLLHFKFEYSGLGKYFNIPKSIIKSKFTEAGYSYDDYEKLICCVPMSILDSDAILKYIKEDLPEIVKKYDNASDLSDNVMEISLKKAIFCFKYFGLTSTVQGKERKSKLSGPLTTFVNSPPLIEDDTIPFNSPKDFLKQKKQILENKEKSKRRLKEDSLLKVEDTEDSKVETKEVVSMRIEKKDTVEESVVPEIEEKVADSISKTKEKKVAKISDDVSKEIGEPYSEYIKALSLEKFVNEHNIQSLIDMVKEELKTKSLDDVLKHYEGNGALILYVIFYKEQLFKSIYSTEFYPFEDKILETMYKDIGVRVVDVIKAMADEGLGFTLKSDFEYEMRVREKGYKTPYYTNGFNYMEYDLELLKALGDIPFIKAKKLLFWLDSYDLYMLAEILGLSFVEPKKRKEEVDLSAIDIRSYISTALKFKEVVNHNVFWTSDKHEIFKDNFRRIGYGVTDLLNCSVEICQEHSLKYKIYQDYTTKEVEEMKVVYEEKGMPGLIEAFPHRTQKALEYKVKEQGWDTASSGVVDSKSVEEEVEKRLEEYKAEVRKELEIENTQKLEKLREGIREEEAEKIRVKVRADETAKIEKDYANRLHKSIEQELMSKMLKVELPKMVKEEKDKSIKQISKEIDTFLRSGLQGVIVDSMQSCSLADLLNTLPAKLQDSVKSEISKVLSKI